MRTQEQQKEGIELMNTLIQEAWENQIFKNELIKNPYSTIESFTGKQMKNAPNVVVEDQTDGSVIYLNIPAKINIEDLELKEEQLEEISGGAIVLTCIALVALGYGGCALIDAID